MFQDLKVPAGFNLVEAENLPTVLSNSGNRGAGYLFRGNKIVVPADARVIGREREAKTANGTETRLIPYIECSIDGLNRWVPFSAFRRFPSKDAAKFAEKSPLLQQLFVGSDAERLSILRGKTIIVSDMVKGQARDWNASPVGTTGDIAYYETEFPLLTEE